MTLPGAILLTGAAAPVGAGTPRTNAGESVLEAALGARARFREGAAEAAEIVAAASVAAAVPAESLPRAGTPCRTPRPNAGATDSVIR